MASGYSYQVLTTSQIKLLDEYAPWAYQVHLSELIDRSLIGETLGSFTSINVELDITGSRDLYITRDGYFGNSLSIGGGYGDTGLTIDTDGNLTTDGYVDCSVGGIRNREESIPNIGTAGIKNEWTYGSPDGGVNWYIYVCVENNTWRRCQIIAW